MRSFFHVGDIGDLGKALEEAKQVKATSFAWQNLGRNKTIILIFSTAACAPDLAARRRL